jgi:hypothetical protein
MVPGDDAPTTSITRQRDQWSNKRLLVMLAIIDSCEYQALEGEGNALSCYLLKHVSFRLSKKIMELRTGLVKLLQEISILPSRGQC